ncbi:MAG: ABC transporter permease subunit, partial [Acidimicrobiales bacterium]
FLRSEYCYQDPAWYGDADKRFWATSILGGETNDWSRTRPDGQPATFTVAGEQVREARFGLEGVIPGVSIFFLVLSIVIGASFVGAEYKFGTVENLLLWEPRRARVLLTKFVAGFTSSFVVTAAMLGLLSALLYAVASVRGTTSGVDSRFWVDLFSLLGRAGIAGGLFFVLAMSVAVIARNTTASVGLLLGWFVISNIVIELAARWFRRWELFMNATAFITESDAVASRKIAGQRFEVFGHGYLTAGLVVAVWALLFATIATLIFNRRDID